MSYGTPVRPLYIVLYIMLVAMPSIFTVDDSECRSRHHQAFGAAAYSPKPFKRDPVEGKSIPNSLYEVYKQKLDRYTTAELNDTKSAAELALRIAMFDPRDDSGPGEVAVAKRKVSAEESSFTNGRYDAVYEEFKDRVGELTASFDPEESQQYVLKKQAPDGRVTTALDSLKGIHQEIQLPDLRDYVERSLFKGDALFNRKDFQRDLKQKVLRKRHKYEEDAECVDSMYESIRDRLKARERDGDDKSPGVGVNEQSSQEESPIYSRPGLYEIRRIQNSLQPSNIRERFYEEYRRNQHRVNSELYGKDRWNERGSRHATPRRQHKKSVLPSDPLHPDANPADQSNSMYPAVLTKALQNSLHPSPSLMPQSLLSTVAQQMNTTSLELAKKLTTHPDAFVKPDLKNNSELKEMLEKYVEAAVAKKQAQVSAEAEEPEETPTESTTVQATTTTTTSAPPAPTPCFVPICVTPVAEEPKETPETPNPERIDEILEKVLGKLESLQSSKCDTPEVHYPEGAPCELFGRWNSMTMGLRLEIKAANDSNSSLPSAESGNTPLDIAAVDHLLLHDHPLLDTDWCFTGTAVNTLGGPFHIYTQSPHDTTIATFVGYCRICGGTDTIIGSWNVLHPSCDCQDITTAMETKRDFMRRYSLPDKRKERYKDILYSKSPMARKKAAQTPACSKPKL